MERVILDSVLESINKLINNSTSKIKMEELHKRHAQKIHFIPIRYRMLGGILQSMNIQFGNFLEEVITQIVSLNSNYKIMPESGKKNVMFEQSRKATNFIDEYIINCQDNAYSDIDLKRQFIKILEKIKNSAIEGPFVKIKHDIDLFFLDKKNNNHIYCEIKYNDDHDTGKFIDINRKFLMTYSLLINKYKSDIHPYIFYFTKKRMKGNPYVPENNILRGDKFFNMFTSIKYDDIDSVFKNISKSPEINKRFDDMANMILNKV